MSKEIKKKDQLTTIEVNGVKFAVDLTKAKQINEFRLGDPIKVMLKKYGDTFEVYPGIITGFDMFQTTPGINIAYVDKGYSPSIEFRTITEMSTEIQIAPMMNIDDVTLEREMVITALNRNIEQRQVELETAIQKKKYFEKHFGLMFSKFINDNSPEEEGDE